MKNCKNCGKQPEENCDEFFGWMECDCGNKSEKVEYFEAEWVVEAGYSSAYDMMMSEAKEHWNEDNK